MSLLDAAIYATHLVFAGLWSGTVLFTSYAVVPTALAGDLRATPLETVTGTVTGIFESSGEVIVSVEADDDQYPDDSIYGGTHDCAPAWVSPR